mmetsp:Transcript_30152/g.65164  ORF Transcript_30152/g.65164 Transcript_30152/m.65164 type:complete len:81 (-) Transcript_30152:197-439(-)
MEGSLPTESSSAPTTGPVKKLAKVATVPRFVEKRWTSACWEEDPFFIDLLPRSTSSYIIDVEAVTTIPITLAFKHLAAIM